ncbi:FAD-binding domain containing protein [Lactarius tabidus]
MSHGSGGIVVLTVALHDHCSCLKGVTSCINPQARIPKLHTHALDVVFTLRAVPGCVSHPGTWADRENLGTTSQFNETCHRIAAAISNASEVFFPPSLQYTSDISHTFASSSQVSVCSVEPGSADDVSKILQIIGSTRTPFAVKGGDHASNPGFSSTRGVPISLARFNNITVDSIAGTVELGSVLTWDQIYTALDPTGVNDIGARLPGVGIAGVTLGGGERLSSHSSIGCRSMILLSVDNVVSNDLVLPNGTITPVTSNNTDLWFALRGGMNNFGIVTNFVVRSFLQSKIWGGILLYLPNQLDAVKDALVKYRNNTDVKASAAVVLNYASGQLISGSFLFYDAPVPPQGLFDDFLAIPTTLMNRDKSSSWQYTELLLRGTQYSPVVFDVFVNQTKFWGLRMAALDPNATVGVTLEPFDNGVFSHGSGSAYPPDRFQAVFPSVLGFTWANSSIDGIVASSMRKEAAKIREVALAGGQNVSHAAVYVNYALFDTPLEGIYGLNVPRLRDIRAAIDPEDVMGLVGGFKF